MYNDIQIIIIDDGSNNDFLNSEGIDLTNCTVIESEYKKRGELLPYYYYYKYKWFDRSIYIHDSVLINEKINLDNMIDVKFLWDFPPLEALYCNQLINKFLSYFNHSDELITFAQDENNWKGCFGAMSVIDYDFLKIIVEKYNMNELLNHITTIDYETNRIERMNFERVFAILCTHTKPSLRNEYSLFGSWNNMHTDEGRKKIEKIHFSR